MKIEKNKVVVLTYRLQVEGRMVDQATEAKPMDYIQGCHMLIPRFEDELDGKQAGDSFSFTIPAAEGYGEYDPELRFDIPKSSFEVNGQLREDLLVPGRIVPMLNGNGELCRALIAEIKEDKVTVDFNHPMAGKTLDFTGTVLSVRDATEKELLEGLHGEFLPQEGCGCHGGCHGGCHEEGGCHGDGCHSEGHCHEEGGCHGEGSCHEGGCHEQGGCQGEGHTDGGCCGKGHCHHEN